MHRRRQIHEGKIVQLQKIQGLTLMTSKPPPHPKENEKKEEQKKKEKDKEDMDSTNVL